MRAVWFLSIPDLAAEPGQPAPRGGHRKAPAPLRVRPVSSLDRSLAVAQHEQRQAEGEALTERGNELGTLDDVTFDPETGALEHLVVGTHHIPAGALLGSGSYAAILDESQETSV
jgi:hypothetical protein